MSNVQKRLEYLRKQIEAECISYSEIAELQSLAKYIEAGDVVLLEWAGVEENPIFESTERTIKRIQSDTDTRYDDVN